MVNVAKYKDDELVTIREAAAILNVSVRTIVRYRENGKIPYYGYSRRKFLYKVRDIKEFCDKSYIAPCEYDE